MPPRIAGAVRKRLDISTVLGPHVGQGQSTFTVGEKKANVK
jgi:hypothetical protein